MQDAPVRDSFYLKRSRGWGGLATKGGHRRGGRCGPSPHPPAEAGCPLSPAPPSGKPGPPSDTRPGPPSISARHLPTHSLPRTQTPSEAGAWTGRVDRQTGHASDSELMHTGLSQASQASQHPPGLAQPLPTPAAHGESAGIGTEGEAVCPHCRGGGAGRARGTCPTAKGCPPCHPKGQPPSAHH